MIAPAQSPGDTVKMRNATLLNLRPHGALLLAIICALCPSFLGAQIRLKEHLRGVETADLVGVWRMVHQEVRPGMGDSAFFSPHQVMHFRADGKMLTVTASSPLPDATIQELLATMPPATQFELSEPGKLLVRRSEKDRDRILASIVIQDMAEPLKPGIPVLKEGQIVLSYFDPQSQVYLQRFLAPAPELEPKAQPEEAPVDEEAGE